MNKSDPTPKEAVGILRGAINSAIWAGLSKEEVKAIVTTILLEK